MSDTRPANCRFRLEEEGKAYPRSACPACGRTITTGLGRACTVNQPAAPSVDITQAAEELASAILPVEFVTRTRFKLSFNTQGNCRSFYNFAEELDGLWVWLVDATDGGNCPLYSESALQRAIKAEREKCAKIADAQAADWLQGVKKANSIEMLNYANGRQDGAQIIAAAIRSGEA